MVNCNKKNRTVFSLPSEPCRCRVSASLQQLYIFHLHFSVYVVVVVLSPFMALINIFFAVKNVEIPSFSGMVFRDADATALMHLSFFALKVMFASHY